MDYGDPVANSHSPPPPEYAVKEVGFRLDYGDPVANSHSPPPPEYDAVEDVGLSLNYGDPRENTPSPPPPEYVTKFKRSAITRKLHTNNIILLS